MGHHKHNTSIKSFIHSVQSGFHTAEHVMTAPIHELGSLGKSLGRSLTIPLAIGGVVVIYLLMRK